MLLLLISFVAGVLTVLAPCVLPLLPVIIGGSLSGEGFHTKKALTIVGSLGVSVIAFTFLLKVSTIFIAIPEVTWQYISGIIILLLGIVTIFPSLWENKMMARLSARSNIMLGKGNKKHTFWGDIIVGAALGPVFSTCSPTYFIVLATVLPVQPVVGIIYLLAYTVGLCLSLLIVSVVGQKLMNRLGVAADPRGTFKRVLGVLFFIVGLAIITGYDKQIESAITGAGFFDVTKIEQGLLQSNMPEPMPTSSTDAQATSTDSVLTVGSTSPSISTTTPKSANVSFLTLAQKAQKFVKSPEISSPDGFINTDGQPITIGQFKGKKVVLLDIWTYSCINCQRTLPYIESWYSKYQDQGLEVIGLHTPEFSFEKVLSNVQSAVERLGVKYPVVLDNDYSTWQALGNQYWPRKYLIDVDGYIVYDHIGEGGYEETEQAIQKALTERNARLGVTEKMPTTNTAVPGVVSVESTKVQSPETYFGAVRNEYLSNGKQGVSGEQTLILPASPLENTLNLGGTWNIQPEYAETKGPTEIVFPYSAKNVYFVAGSSEPMDIQIYQDDLLVNTITIHGQQLYTIISGTKYGAHTLKIKIPKAGLQAFTFTFG